MTRTHLVKFGALAWFCVALCLIRGAEANSSHMARRSAAKTVTIPLELQYCGPPGPTEGSAPSNYGLASECCEDEMARDASRTIPADTSGIAVVHVPLQRAVILVTSSHGHADVTVEFHHIDGSRFLTKGTLTDSTGTARIDFSTIPEVRGMTGYYYLIGYSIDECARTVFRINR
jgi:hypothetical protein